jgi:monolysocardiolipin acyltransferase
MEQTIALLSGPATAPTPGEVSFTTDGTDSFFAPAAYAANRNAWIHVFPEACCHQSPDLGLRYFKWGVSRLILESEPAPEFIPMFIDGTQDIMPENRGFPRFLPRIGNHIRVAIGKPVNSDRVFGDYRRKWRKLAEKASEEEKMNSLEAVQLRIDVAKAVRDEVLKLRESLGFPREQDETAALADTWSKEPNKRKFKSPVDGSLVNRH